MKFLNKNILAVISALVALLILCSFMIIRLELKAASLQSRIDEHHSQLKNNSDDLDNLVSFLRRVGDNIIFMDNSMLQIGSRKSRLTFSGDDFKIGMGSGKRSLEISDPNELIQLLNENSKIKLKNDNIKIETKGDLTLSVSANKDFGYNKDEDLIYLRNEESRITIGEIFGKNQKSLGKGIDLVSKSGGPFLTVKEDQIMIDAKSKNGKHQLFLDPTQDLVALRQGNSKVELKRDSVTIQGTEDISIGPATDKTLGYLKDRDEIYMQYMDSKILLGEILSHDGKSLGNGINIVGKTGGPYIVVRDNKISLEVPSDKGRYRLWIDPTKQLVGMTQGQSQVTIKNDEIKIEAEGDINITSKKGKVNINGKN